MEKVIELLDCRVLNQRNCTRIDQLNKIYFIHNIYQIIHISETKKLLSEFVAWKFGLLCKSSILLLGNLMTHFKVSTEFLYEECMGSCSVSKISPA